MMTSDFRRFKSPRAIGCPFVCRKWDCWLQSKITVGGRRSLPATLHARLSRVGNDLTLRSHSCPLPFHRVQMRASARARTRAQAHRRRTDRRVGKQWMRRQQARCPRAECPEPSVGAVPILSWIQPPSGPTAAISTMARSMSNIGVLGSTNIPKLPKGGGGDSGATNELCSTGGPL